MKRHFDWCLLSLLAAACFACAMSPSIFAEQQPKAAPGAQVQESDNTDYSEDEYAAYDAAKKEPDAQKRSVLLLAFLQKFPKPTTLTPYIDFEYRQLLDDLSAAKKWGVLEATAENWLKIHPNDVRAIGHIADATGYLNKYDKCGKYLEELYKLQPSPTLARSLYQTYQGSNNPEKQMEWSDRLFKMPEFDADYALRWDFVLKHMKSNNIPKAAEYAQLTLKSADLVKSPPQEQQEELQKIRKVCYHVIGVNLLEKNKCDEAIATFDKAIRIERYSDGYYFMGKCLDTRATAARNQDMAEEAMNAYTKAELLGGDNAVKARERTEQIFKALHNDRTIGIDKIYNRAKKELGRE